jgi:ABC-type multidrug transport system ATPase subunit
MTQAVDVITTRAVECADLSYEFAAHLAVDQVNKRRVADALEAMGLTEAAGRLAGTYSGGMVRRLELAQ